MTISNQSVYLDFAKSQEELVQVVALRVDAYGRHEGRENLVDAIKHPDAWDTVHSVLVAKDESTERMLGSIRLHMSNQASSPMPKNIDLSWAGNSPVLYVDRFCVASGSQGVRVAKQLHLKTHEVAKGLGVDWVVIISLEKLLPYYFRVGFSPIPGPNAQLAVPGLKAEPYYVLRAHVHSWFEVLEAVAKRPLARKPEEMLPD